MIVIFKLNVFGILEKNTVRYCYSLIFFYFYICSFTLKSKLNDLYTRSAGACFFTRWMDRIPVCDLLTMIINIGIWCLPSNKKYSFCVSYARVWQMKIVDKKVTRKKHCIKTLDIITRVLLYSNKIQLVTFFFFIYISLFCHFFFFFLKLSYFDGKFLCYCRWFFVIFI